MKILYLVLFMLIGCDINKFMGNDEWGRMNTESEMIEYRKTHLKPDSTKWVYGISMHTYIEGTPLRDVPEDERMYVAIELTIKYNDGLGRLSHNDFGYTFIVTDKDPDLDRENLYIEFEDDSIVTMLHTRYSVLEDGNAKSYYGSHDEYNGHSGATFYGIIKNEILFKIKRKDFVIKDKDGIVMNARSTSIFKRLASNLIIDFNIIK